MADKKDNKDENQEPETLFEFPCDFPVKIMGKAHEDLRKAVEDILAEHASDFDSKNITIRESKDGNYHALTATIRATSKPQLDAIYHALTDHDLVLMAL